MKKLTSFSLKLVENPIISCSVKFCSMFIGLKSMVSFIRKATPPPLFVRHLYITLYFWKLSFKFANWSEHLISFSETMSGLYFSRNESNSRSLFLIELQFQWWILRIFFVVEPMFTIWKFKEFNSLNSIHLIRWLLVDESAVVFGFYDTWRWDSDSLSELIL